MLRLIALFAVSLIFLTSCLDYRVVWEDETYAVFEIDSQGMELGRTLDSGWIGRVESTIFGVGSDERFVVVARVDLSAGAIEYYYIDKLLDHDYADVEDAVFGPFIITEFAVVVQEVELPKFEKSFVTGPDLGELNRRFWID